MFCIRSDVITLGSIEMYGLVTIWTSMDDGPYWVILLMYGSHDMRHTGFRRLTVVKWTPSFGVSHLKLSDPLIVEDNLISCETKNSLAAYFGHLLRH